MSAFALLIPPATLAGHLHRLTERSPTQQRISVAAAASVHGLARYIFREADSTSVLLRFFK